MFPNANPNVLSQVALLLAMALRKNAISPHISLLSHRGSSSNDWRKWTSSNSVSATLCLYLFPRFITSLKCIQKRIIIIIQIGDAPDLRIIFLPPYLFYNTFLYSLVSVAKKKKKNRNVKKYHGGCHSFPQKYMLL